MSVAATNANLIGGPLAEAVDVNDDAVLVIGNEGRVVGTTGSTEGLLGLIDEVRISNIARAATNFIGRPRLRPTAIWTGWRILGRRITSVIFRNPGRTTSTWTHSTTSRNSRRARIRRTVFPRRSTPMRTGCRTRGEQAYFSSLAQTGAGDFDGDGFTNLQEYNAAPIRPTRPSRQMTPMATVCRMRGSSNTSGSLAQTASGDFDGDSYSNLIEYQAGTSPTSASSFPSRRW